MNDQHKCAGQVWGHMTHYRCDKIGRHEHEGKWYCKTHHPPTKQAKQQARNEKWRAEFDARERASTQKKIAQDEMRRKADAYDGLVAERDALKAAAEKGTEYVLAQINQDLKAQRDAAVAALEMIAGVRPCLDNLMSDKDIARAAIRARGEV